MAPRRDDHLQPTVSTIYDREPAATRCTRNRHRRSPRAMKSTVRSWFIVTLGVLTALALGAAVLSLGYARTLVFVAFFVALGLDPRGVVRRLERLGMGRVRRALRCRSHCAFAVLLLSLTIPLLVNEASRLLVSLPVRLQGVETQGWFMDLDDPLGGALLRGIQWLEHAVAVCGQRYAEGRIRCGQRYFRRALRFHLDAVLCRQPGTGQERVQQICHRVEAGKGTRNRRRKSPLPWASISAAWRYWPR